MAREAASKWSYLLAALVPLTIGAQGVHWLITPASASASAARWWAVVAQAVLGVGVGCWVMLRGRGARGGA